MSRIGRMPISVPAGVVVTNNNNLITVKGAKGEITKQFSKELGIEINDGVVTVTRPSENKIHKSTLMFIVDIDDLYLEQCNRVNQC